MGAPSPGLETAPPNPRHEGLDEARWGAVRERRATASGSFVYAVRTTGVFCRPTCTARRPRRENVVFFDDAGAAARAGFRPCRRCAPEGPEGGSRAGLAERACRRLEAAEGEPGLAELAREAGLSPQHFQRVFKAEVGLTPKAYARSVRAARLRRALEEGESVTHAIYDAGFAAPSRAYETAARELAMTPGRWRRGGAGETIRYALARCNLGHLLVAGTRRGICAVELGDDREALVAGLRERFHAASIEAADERFPGWVETLLRFIEAPSRELALPLDIQGTAFQRRVWSALREIPPGARITYAELARRIGRPGAARAVARACAGNRIAIAIPCHRVVPSDGGIGGYRWGAARKSALLERESMGRGREETPPDSLRRRDRSCEPGSRRPRWLPRSPG